MTPSRSRQIGERHSGPAHCATTDRYAHAGGGAASGDGGNSRRAAAGGAAESLNTVAAAVDCNSYAHCGGGAGEEQRTKAAAPTAGASIEGLGAERALARGPSAWRLGWASAGGQSLAAHLTLQRSSLLLRERRRSLPVQMPAAAEAAADEPAIDTATAPARGASKVCCWERENLATAAAWVDGAAAAVAGENVATAAGAGWPVAGGPAGLQRRMARALEEALDATRDARRAAAARIAAEAAAARHDGHPVPPV